MGKIIIAGLLPLLVGCPTNCDLYYCDTVFIISGKVIDSSNAPLEGVKIDFVSHYGNKSFLASTNTDGEYSVILDGPGSKLGNAYLIFTAQTFKDLDTKSQPLGEKDGICEPETHVVRNATMESQ